MLRTGALPSRRVTTDGTPDARSARSPGPAETGARPATSGVPAGVTPPAVVTQLYERFQARDWDGATRLLHADAQLHMPATDERLVGREQVIRLQREYPEPWGELRVLRAASAPDTAVAEIEIKAPDGRYRCAAFWTVRDGLLYDGVEYWVTVGGMPADPARRPG